MYYKLIDSDKYDLRMQTCNVVEKANNFARTVANEWPELDDYQINAFKRLTEEMQMLESMISASRPTRAEASDVANAVLDGADALMLSGETSVGENPVLVVETMAKIIEHVEEEALEQLPKLEIESQGSTGRALTTAAVAVGKSINAKYLIGFTETGRSVRLMARHRSTTPILAFTTEQSVQRQLSLIWGCQVFRAATVKHTDEMVAQVDRYLTENDFAKYGELVVVVAGVPPGVPGTTNGMRVHKVGTGADES